MLSSLGPFLFISFFFFFRLQSSDCVKLLVLLLLFRLHSGPFPDGLKLNDRQEATVSSSSPVRRQMTLEKTTHVPMFKEFQPKRSLRNPPLSLSLSLLTFSKFIVNYLFPSDWKNKTKTTNFRVLVLG